MKELVIASGLMKAAPFPADAVIYSDRHSNREGRQNNFQRELFHHWILNYLEPYHTTCSHARGEAPLTPPRSQRETEKPVNCHTGESDGWLIIDCGDSFDVIEALRLKPILDWNFGLECRLAHAEKYLFPGNHDGELKDLPDWLNYYVIADPGQWPLAHIEHGDMLDPACHGAGRLDRVGGWVWGVLEWCGLGRALSGIKARVERWSSRRRPTASRRGDDNYEQKLHACDLLEAAEAEGRELVLVMMGHTHKAELFEFSAGRFYANPGSWTEKGKCHAIRVRGRLIELLRIEE